MDTQTWLMVPLVAAGAVLVAVMARAALARPRSGPDTGPAADESAPGADRPAPPAPLEALPNR